MFVAGELDEALKMLGDLLADRGHHYEVVAIGGGALRWLPSGPAPTGASEPDEEQALPSSRARNVLWLVTAVLAVAMSVLRNCTQG